MELPITEAELNIIMNLLKGKDNKLYNKLWSYQINRKIQKDKN